ncbi:MAG: TRAP transporter small permease subunit [Pseudomonadales bacterium]|nr:TRAP transporter small permease subunit [Pseudomonadales bacterium]
MGIEMRGLVNQYNLLLGKFLAALLIIMTLLTATVVFQRYGLDQGSIFQQELVTYLHATLFMLGASYTLKQDEHVRVDIFYQSFNVRQKAWVNCVGHLLFLLPMSAFIGLSSLEFVQQSWLLRETSAEPGGIPAVFLLKTLIPLLSLTLFLQGLADFFQQARVLVFDDLAESSAQQ